MHYSDVIVKPPRGALVRDLMILASEVRIPLWDVGAGLSDETV
jgi:hypothetical protein